VTNPYYWSPDWRALRAAALRRDLGRCTAPGCAQPAVIVDHITTRPRVPHPTPADTLDNLRSLCRAHDNQIKEQRGKRRRTGVLAAKGCDADGWPLSQTQNPYPKGIER
jgi:5-methylcytosine-specific restriction endonuclease McrA